jgi:hypothetical protein
LVWYHCNFPKLNIYHYNSPIQKYTIITSSFTDPYHLLRHPAIGAHCHVYIYCASFCMDDFAPYAKCEELRQRLIDVWDSDVRLSSTSSRPGSPSIGSDMANSAYGEQAAASTSPVNPGLHSVTSLHHGGHERIVLLCEGIPCELRVPHRRPSSPPCSGSTGRRSSSRMVLVPMQD